MNCYFEEGEVFTWIRDRERSGENMVVSLKMLKNVTVPEVSRQ